MSADGVYSRGYNQFNNRDLNPRDPATGTRPNPDYLRITNYETEGHAWYKALLMSLEKRAAVRVPGFGVWSTLAEAIRDVEGFLFLAQDQLNPAAEKVARQQRPAASAGRPLQLDDALRDIQLAGLVQYRSGQPWNVDDRPRQQSRCRGTNDRPDLAVPERQPARSRDLLCRLHQSRRQPAGATPIRARRSSRSTPGCRSSSRSSGSALEAFIEAFNLANKVELRHPGWEPALGDLWDVDGIQGNQRQIELGFRLDF